VIQSKSDVTPPESILDLGLRHSEQISLLEKIQNSILAEQSKLIARKLVELWSEAQPEWLHSLKVSCCLQ